MCVEADPVVGETHESSRSTLSTNAVTRASSSADSATRGRRSRTAGEAESGDGKADVIDVKGEGDFNVRLFVDASTHLPLMVSWMDKEPLVMTMGASPTMTPEEREKMMKDLDARRKEAEAKLRTVEYRIYYGDYKSVGGVQLPHTIQRSIDGKPTEEMIFDTVKVNPKVDAKKFQVAK